MRIFISSLVPGMEDMRRAAREAVTVLEPRLANLHYLVVEENLMTIEEIPLG
jgi:hypothetical protein